MKETPLKTSKRSSTTAAAAEPAAPARRAAAKAVAGAAIKGASSAMAKRGTAAGAPAPTAMPERRKRLSRAELLDQAREKIFRAAAAVVGEHGYAEASISKITERAGIAQGTFYLYFSSRQALFDELLPHIGEELVVYVGQAVHNASSVYELEERGFRAFFDFLRQSSGFFQVLNEAETWAPKAHAKHLKLLTDHYVASLQRSVDRGEIRAFDARELEVTAYVFMGARSYLYMRFLKGSKNGTKLPEWVVKAYMKLVREGLR